MHLFEPRWVNMVDSARTEFNGIIALIYFGPSMELLRTATLAEVITCGNLGVAGRMVTVRGVGRAKIQDLAPEVISADEWGIGIVKEMAELDEDPDGKGGVETAVASLEDLMKNLDLSPPGSGSKDSNSVAPDVKEDDGEEEQGEQEEGAQKKQPELWTHERASMKEYLGQDWRLKVEGVQKELAEVPLCWRAGVEQGNDAPSAVALLYGAIGGAPIDKRLEVFCSDKGLAERLRMTDDSLRELQGMAVARRSLATIFQEDT